MTEEAQRIAIAEACGWKSHIHGSPETPAEEKLDAYHGLSPGQVVWMTPGGIYVKGAPPDYLNDLNAMHEVEKVLTQEQQLQYDFNLSEIVAPITGERWELLHASAAQRAEAFLKTLNLWTE